MKSILLSALAALTAASAIPDLTAHSQSLVRRSGGTCTSGSSALLTPQVIPSYENYGTHFCETGFGTDYKPITQLTVWSVANYVKAIQATYADGSLGPVIGTTTNYKKETIGVDYALGQTWSAVYLFGPPNNGNLQHLTLRTSNGGVLNAGEPVSDGLTAHPIPVGAGILMGYTGSAGNIINSLGFMFLASPIKSIAVSNLQFTNFPTGSQGINPENLLGAHYYNSQTNSDSTWSFSNTVTKTVTRTYSQTTTNAFQVQLNIQFSIQGMIPGITIGSQVQNNYQWSTTYAYQTMVSKAEAIAVTWAAGGTLHPGQGVDCVAITGTAQGTFNYVSDVNITLQNGASYTFKEAGALNLADSSKQATVLTSSADHP